VVWLQSWGVYYVHRVRVTLDDIQVIAFAEEGDVAVVTDR
jgi:hypothetical protein